MGVVGNERRMERSLDFGGVSISFVRRKKMRLAGRIWVLMNLLVAGLRQKSQKYFKLKSKLTHFHDLSYVEHGSPKFETVDPKIKL